MKAVYLTILIFLGAAIAVPVVEQPLFGESTYVAEWEKFVITLITN